MKQVVVARHSRPIFSAARRRPRYRRARAGDFDVASRDRRNHSPASRLDVVAIETVLGAAEPRRRLRRASSTSRPLRSRRPSRAETGRARRRAAPWRRDGFGSPFRGCRGEERGLGAGHRCFVEIERRAARARRRLERVARLVELHGAHRRERLQGAWRSCGAPENLRRAGPAVPILAARAADRAAAPSREAFRPVLGRAGRS